MIFLFIALVGVTAFAVKAQGLAKAQQIPVRITETASVKPLTKTDFYPTSKDVASVSQMVTEGGPIIFNPVAKSGGGAPSSSAGVPPGAPGGAPSGAGGGGTGATGGRGVPNVY